MFTICLISGLFSISCAKTSPLSEQVSDFDTIPVSHLLIPTVNEISGIADSKSNPGFLWGHEDSGTPPQLYLISKEGIVKKTIYIKGADNRDWEDICLSGNFLYIADIGDNNSIHGTYYIYKFPEPNQAIDTVKAFDKISFQYPDGNHDAEAFIVDPTTSDIYIITKRDSPSKIYKLSHSYSTNSINKLQFVANLGFNGIVSAALSNDQNSLLIKTYFTISQYKKSPGQSLQEVFANKPVTVGYKIEPQGEAICYATNDSGFFTLSEKGMGTNVILYFYPTKK
jgi:hypothetical protein